MVGVGMIFEETWWPLFQQVHREGLYQRATGLVEVEMAALASRTGKRAASYVLEAERLGMPAIRNLTGSDAIEQMLALKNITRQNTAADEYSAKRSLQAVSGIGGYPFVGTPDRVAEEFAAISRAGVRGIAISFVNYLKEAPYFCAEVLPRLARMGLRS